jgi:DNA-directed RNA polymerase specialized sigma24 family protein
MGLSMSEAMPTVPWSPLNDINNPHAATDGSAPGDPLADPTVRKDLVAFVRRRVPARDVDDVVQTVLCAALGMPNRPRDPDELRRWVLGVAHHKVVDFHRRAEREPSVAVGEVPSAPPPVEARELVRWAEKQAGPAGDAQKTLAWMAREGEGEKLESIAEDEKLPATRIRQRVSRMRRWMKKQWLAELAAVAALTVAVWWLLRVPGPEKLSNGHPAPLISSEPADAAIRARWLRGDAQAACDRGEWHRCLDTLDQAKVIDPAGDSLPAVGAARRMAETGLGRETPANTAAPAPLRAPPPYKKQLVPAAPPKPVPFDGSQLAPSTPPPTKANGKPSAPKKAWGQAVDPGAVDVK